jgi:RHS repeat-associated protein
MIRQTDGNDHSTSYQRDPREHVVAIIDPLNRARTMAYDPAGNLTTLVDQAGRTTTDGYDPANELTSISYSSGSPAARSFSYDHDGNQTSAGGDTFSYDSIDRLASTSNQYGQSTNYTYDLANEITKIAYPPGILPAATTSALVKQNTGIVTHEFDQDGNLTKITDWLGNANTFIYDAQGQLTGRQLADGSRATDTLDHNGAITAISDQSPNNYAFSAAYTRTPEELLSGANESQNTGGSNYSYTYDQNGRLKASTTQGSLTTPSPYAYDAADNLTSQPNTTGSLGQSYDVADQLTSATNSLTAAKQTYTYDPLGERIGQTDSTSGGMQTYNYDQAGQLASYTSAAQNEANKTSSSTTATASYGYDATGLRNDRNVNQLHNIDAWDRTSSLPMLLTDATTSYIYGPDALPLEQIDATGTIHYYHHDQLGSTRALTDKNGRPTNTYTYDPYGNLQGNNPAAAATTNPFLYAGQYTDPETGLQYLRARYYDPTTGQFITRDPLEAVTHAPYSYSTDDPTNISDPSGRCSLIGCIGLGIGVGASCLAGPEVCIGAAELGLAAGEGNGGGDSSQSPGDANPQPAGNDKSDCRDNAGASGIPTGAKPPTAAYPGLQRSTGLSRGELSDAFHRIKHAAGLPPNAPTRIDSEGNVYDADTGENIGNVVDEAHG